MAALRCVLTALNRSYLVDRAHINRLGYVISRGRRKDFPPPDEEVISLLQKEEHHPQKERFPGEYDVERPKGRIYDKKPFKVALEAEKRYSWCTCGYSKNQPFCDGSHKKLGAAPLMKGSLPKYNPLRFTVPESKEYWLCNCKQTAKAPFCDGTHKRSDIQEAIRS